MTIKQLTRKSDAHIEDKCLCYTDGRGIEHSIKLTEDQFALFELGFRDGHNEGFTYAISTLEGNHIPKTFKQLEKIYG